MSFYVDDKDKILELEFRDYEIVDGVKTDIGPLNISVGQITDITFLFQREDGTSPTSKTYTGGEVVLSTDGTDGKAYYKTETGFFDVHGEWSREGKVVFADGSEHYSGIVTFDVKDHL